MFVSVGETAYGVEPYFSSYSRAQQAVKRPLESWEAVDRTEVLGKEAMMTDLLFRLGGAYPGAFASILGGLFVILDSLVG